MSRGKIIVISGFSGVGKGTVMKELVKSDDYALSVSATTRAPRPGETEGISYFYKTTEEFENMIQTECNKLTKEVIELELQHSSIMLNSSDGISVKIPPDFSN
mgnify:CR=1 FL=1